MSGASHESEPGDEPIEPAEIPSEVEAQVLEILDVTEPGTARQAAISALNLPTDQHRAVTRWLRSDEAESDFLASPVSGTESPAGPASHGTLPRRLGEYELESVLGKGGMGVVYRARDLRLGRVVALKVLPERFADNPKRLQRFEREVRAVAALRHPNIVPVYQAAKIGEVPFFTMELVAGKALNEVIAHLGELNLPVGSLRLNHWRDALDLDGDGSGSADRTYLEAVCNVVIQIAEALQHAHDNKVVHRDVKPSNIMSGGSDQAKLFDFGLARLDDDDAMTQSSEMVGSPHYMSPEQVRSRGVDFRTDIYSLGVTLYELLTLHVPFEVVGPQQLYQAILNRDPKRPSVHNPQLPSDLETICLTAMEKDPERRFPSAAEFAEDLRRFLRFEPIHARPISSVTRGIRWLRRKRTQVTIVVLILITVGVGFLAKTIYERLDIALGELETAGSDIRQAETDLLETRAEVDRTKAAIEKAKKDLEELNREAKEQRATHAKEKADSARQIADLDKQIRGKETTIKNLESTRDRVLGQSEQLTKQLVEKNEELRDVGSELKKGKAEIERLLTDIERSKREFGTLLQNQRITNINRLLLEAQTLSRTNSGLGLILAHEAALLADAEDSGVDRDLQMRIDDTLLVLLGSTQEERTFSQHEHPVTVIDFDPTGDTLVSASDHGVAHLWRRNTGAVLASLRDSGVFVHLECVRRHHVLLAKDDGAIVIWNGRSNATAEPLESAHHHPGVRAHASPGGRFLVSHASRLPGKLVVHDSRSRRIARTIGEATSPIVNFEFGPEGDLLVVTTSDRQVQLWDLAKGEIRRRVIRANPVLSATLDTRASRIACLGARGTVLIVNSRDGAILLERQIQNGQPLGSGRIAFCAEDRRLMISATGSDDLRVLDARTGDEVASVRVDDPAAGFELAPKNRLLACIPVAAGGIDLVNTLDGATVAHLGGPADRMTARYRPTIAFSPEGTSVATAHGETDAHIWRAGPGGHLRALGPRMSGRGSSDGEILISGRFEPANGRVMTVSNRGLSSWHLLTGRRIFHPQNPLRPLVPEALAAGVGVTFSDKMVHVHEAGARPKTRQFAVRDPERVDIVTCWPDGSIAVVRSDRDDDNPRTLQLFDRAGSEMKSIELPFGQGGGGWPLPSPDGTRFAIGYGTLRIVDTMFPRRRVGIPLGRQPIAFSPDSKRVACSTGFGVRVSTAETGGVWCTLRDLPSDDSELTDLAFSHDGDRLATAWSDGMIRIHDCRRRSGALLQEITAHRLRVHSVRFSHDARLIVSSSADQTTRLTETSSGRRRLTFQPGESCIHAEFAPTDDKILVICPTSLHTFPVDPRPLAARACPRTLTPAERIEYELR